jgi:putative YphP/YqiW family bacilliredoxin
MRQDLTQYGVEEARSANNVDELLAPGSGTVMIVVNSVCGCAAAKARPAIGMAMRHTNRPDRAVTVFAGGDVEAVARVRELAAGYPPSSPSVILFRDGKVIYMLHRSQIESRQAPEIAQLLTQAFDEHCVKQPS